MTRRLVLYEDRHWRSLRPLTDVLPLPALRFGASDLARRWIHSTAAPLLAIEARASVMAAWSDAPTPDAAGAREADEVLVVNSAALPGDWLPETLAERQPALFMGDGQMAAARLPLSQLRGALGRGADFETVLLGLGLPVFPVSATFLRFPWNLWEHNAAAIASDLARVPGIVRGEVHRTAAILAPERVHVEAGARIGPFAVLDAEAGPILVRQGASVAAHTVITGPCVIGAGTQLLGGFVSRSTFGPECRVAGEVEDCVWQGFGNKRHHGFVGHSAIGEWVNLGALTTTSDLKNNYGTVRVHVDGADLDSGSPKVGSLIGAHVKTGIGTLLPTGASVGVAANLFGGGRFAPKRVPSFGWWDGERMLEHALDKCLATGRIAMSRRGRTFGRAEERILRDLFDSTARERLPMNGLGAS